MASTPQFIGTYRSSQTQLVAAHAARPRPIWTPGSNGSRIHSVNIATNDSAGSQTVSLYRATALTLGSAMGSGQLTGSSTITRSAGDFTADGWLANQRIFIYGSTTLANDEAINLTTVASGTLTLGAANNTTEAFPSTGQLMRASLIATISLPASSGANSSTVPLNVLNPNLMPFLIGAPDNFLMLGSADMLLAAVGNSVSSGKSVDIVVDGGDY
ncbi:MAG TPA: hypothetical protein VGO93_08665 [Candidatus Xenobia bacterium]|jgi:hypothetical protein